MGELRLSGPVVRVSRSDFLDVWLAAQRLRAREPESRYAAAVNATFNWLGGIRSAPSPMTNRTIPVTLDSAMEEQMGADAVVFGWKWADHTIHREWALGVHATLGWARGLPWRAPVTVSASTRTS